jgi:HK97 gp10 family phage protein
MAKFRVINQSRLRRKLRRFPEELRADIRNAMVVSAAELRDEIRANAPRKTGALAEAADYTLSRDGLSAKVGYSREAGFKRQFKRAGFKAHWLEFGTKHSAAQPFIRPAYRAKLKGILNRIDSAVRKTLRRASTGDF